MTTHPCPICNGTNSEECTACKGVGCFPYPWVTEDDARSSPRWTGDESEIVIGSPTPHEAYRRFTFVFGVHERTYKAVYRYWTRHGGTTGGAHAKWTDDEVVTIRQPKLAAAVEAYHAEFGTERTERAIQAKYLREKAIAP